MNLQQEKLNLRNQNIKNFELAQQKEYQFHTEH
jgi:hypothetical protein